MNKEITSLIDDLKSNKKLTNFDEASTKQAVVLRLLTFLGWDIFNVEEVYPDYAANSSNVSYALRLKSSNKVFIEVKRVQEKLDKYQKQFVTLASDNGVDLAVLTNGVTWWFYLIPVKDNWQQKWFYSVDLLKQNPDAFVPHLIDLLTKNKIARGQSLKAAQSLYDNKMQKMAADFLPQAWNQIISQPNKIFVELLSEYTEKLCGYKVDTNSIEKFLTKNFDKWKMQNVPSSGAAPPAVDLDAEILDLEKKPSSNSKEIPAAQKAKKTESYADKKIESYTFKGHTYTVRSWEEMLTTLCDHFAAKYSKDFEKVLWISNDQKPHFSRYSDQLRMPEKIKKTDIFVETKLNPDETVKTAGKLLTEFGYSKDELVINVQ
ncbi:MAG: hypothetical protein PVG70_00505 [Desulfobacterales bacterium]|jgi:hypothetical protein